MIFVSVYDFLTWRQEARKLLESNTSPYKIIWNNNFNQTSLFPNEICINPNKTNFNIPSEFLELAKIVCYHRNEERFGLLYQMLWRLIHENKNLLFVQSDPLTNQLYLMKQAIIRDVHKTKAFVRFKKTYDEYNNEHFVAWYKPDHYSLKLSAPFFKRRFEIMKWTILTPDESVHWDKEFLHFGNGANSLDVPKDNDITEDLWKEFYRAIFNPARIKIKAMKREMPVRHWPTLPETSIIQNMLNEAPERVQEMIKHQEGYKFSAYDFIPKTDNLEVLKESILKCKGCPLYQKTTQTVFGIGPSDAEIVLVGDQPDDEEDKSGQIFTARGGKILDKALKEAELDRSKLYLTNAIKHFKFNLQNNRRIQVSPDTKDIINCKAWIEAEIEIIKPKIIICLGVIAAKSLIDPLFKLSTSKKIYIKDNIVYITTYHPSTIFKFQYDESIYKKLVEDLKIAKNHLNL